MCYQIFGFFFLILSNYINSNYNEKLRLNNLKVPKISVIIPVYNMEKFVKECLNSVVNQSLKDIEIICIDDGSIDNSLQILKDYEKNDKRIKILSQKNNGVGSARNRGIDISKGEFIAFLDSDDKYINMNSLENLYNAAVNNKVLISGGNSNKYINEKKVEKLDYFEKEGIVYYSDFQKPYYFWKYIYNTSFIKKNKIYFPNYSRFQDPVFFVKAMNEAKYFYALPQDVHYYRASDTMMKMNEKKMIDTLKGMLDILKYSDKNNLNILFNNIVNKFNHPFIIKMIKKFINNKDVKNLIVEIIRYINLKKIKRINKNFKFNDFYMAIMEKIEIKNSDL